MDWFDEFVAAVDPIDDPNLGKKRGVSVGTFLVFKNRSSTRADNFAANALRFDSLVAGLSVGMPQRN